MKAVFFSFLFQSDLKEHFELSRHITFHISSLI